MLKSHSYCALIHVNFEPMGIYIFIYRYAHFHTLIEMCATIKIEESCASLQAGDANLLLSISSK